MNSKVKTFLIVGVTTVFFITAYILYNYFSKNYDKKDNPFGSSSSKNDSSISIQDSAAENSSLSTGLEKAYDFTVYDKDGNKVKLSDFFGKPIVLNFWASWCPPCKGEMPHFEKLYKEFGDEVVFIMVDSVDGQRETKKAGEAFIKEMGYTFPVYFDLDSDAAEAYQIYSLPTTIIINRNGEIVSGVAGALEEEDLRQGISIIKQD